MSARYDHLRHATSLAERTHDRIAAAVSGLAFWTAILIPFAYPLFLVRGISTESQLTTLLLLLSVNYLALLLGHSHHDRPEP